MFMSTDWWPTLLAHIPKEDPWGAQDVVVAEIKSFDEKPHAGARRTFAALVPMEKLDAVKGALAQLHNEVSTSGVNPTYRSDVPFEPRFWIGSTSSLDDRYEPLILAWESNNITVLQPDPAFLMTYGLTPRPGKDGAVHWDDPQIPRHNIVTVSAPSRWESPLGTHAYVTISRDFLQDYLTLRQMALVQVFFEQRWGDADAEAKERLGKEESVVFEYPNTHFQLGFNVGSEGTIYAQAWGGRVIALPKDTPISADPLDGEGLNWPGIARPVTNQVARTLSMEFVYVHDAVLGEYEDKLGYEINPEIGSVDYGTQWGVGFCRRLGRNLIRLEVRKLYGSVPPSVTRLWNRYAAEPVAESAYPAIFNEPNIATRAKAVTYAVVKLGEALSQVAEAVRLRVPPEDFVSLRRKALDYHGWWTFDRPRAISHHVPLTLGRDGFLDRCMSLDKLITEGLSESNLRDTLTAMGVPDKETNKLRALKLLDALIRVAQIARSTGLDIATDGAMLWDRLAADGTKPEQPIAHLFALYDVRILKAHKAGDTDKSLKEELKRFGVTPGEEVAGYGKILDHIYDILAEEIQAVAQRLVAPLR